MKEISNWLIHVLIKSITFKQLPKNCVQSFMSSESRQHFITVSRYHARSLQTSRFRQRLVVVVVVVEVVVVKAEANEERVKEQREA